jgi:hypothetical protein
VAQVVECLPTKFKTLHSNPSTFKKKNKQKAFDKLLFLTKNYFYIINCTDLTLDPNFSLLFLVLGLVHAEACVLPPSYTSRPPSSLITTETNNRQ